MGVQPEPPLADPDVGSFASNGNYLLFGKSFLVPIPTFSEYDGQTFDLVQHIAIDTGKKEGVVETLDGASYLVSEANLSQIDAYDIQTSESGGVSDDLAWAPNGHLWVLGVLGTPAVIEYDGQTGEFRGFVVPPAETPPLSLVFSLGGPFGNFFFPSAVDSIINIIEVDRGAAPDRTSARRTR